MFPGVLPAPVAATSRLAQGFVAGHQGQPQSMLYTALLLPVVLMASLFVMARLERWIGRDSDRETGPIAPPSSGLAHARIGRESATPVGDPRPLPTT